MRISLFDLMYNLVENANRMTGYFPRPEKVRENTEYIMAHSSVKYDHTGLWLKSYSAIGVKQAKEVIIQVPKYIIFKITEDDKKWELSTCENLEQIEEVLRYLEDYEISVVMIDGIITQYNHIEEPFKSRIIWKNPIYQIQYQEQNGEKNSELIYDRSHLEAVIIDKFKQGYKNLMAFNVLEQQYDDFFITAVVYSTDSGNRPPKMHLGKSEMTFIELSGEEDFVW